MALNRTTILGSLFAVLLVSGLVWRTVQNWGRVTLDVDKMALHLVIKKIEGQGRIDIGTNLDSNTPVTLRLKKASAAEAVDRLAVATDANWRLSYFMAPRRGAVKDAIAQWEGGNNLENWRSIEFRMPFGMMDDEAVTDPRSEDWMGNILKSGSLSSVLAEVSKRVDVTFRTPNDWDPNAARIPVSGKVSDAVVTLAKNVNASATEIFLLRKSGRGEWGGPDGPPREQGGDQTARAERAPRSPDGQPEGRERRFGNMAPEEREALMKERIAKMPPERQKEALDRMEQFRKLREEMKDLPEAERREKMRELFNTPEIQARMDERMSSRDARMSPDQRRDRYQRYVDRKLERKNAPPAP